MPEPSNEAARWIPLMVIGISLITLGIVLPLAAPARWALMAAGISLLLVAVAIAKGRGGPRR